MIDRKHNQLSLSRQCCLLQISRSSLYREPVLETPENLKLMALIDRQFLRFPYYGSRKMTKWLALEGYRAGRHRVRRLMRKMGLRAIYQAPNTSRPHPEHRIYPYLLRGLAIDHPNQVWATDITYIPMPKGFLFLVAIMDWYSRKVLAWRLSNTMDAHFCVEALEEALYRYGRPDIFNTDQGSQFTSNAFTGLLTANGIRISMDGKGRCMDNVFVERLWRSLKYEDIYLKAYANGIEAKDGIGNWFHDYNTERIHQSLDYRTPAQVYTEGMLRPNPLKTECHTEGVAA